MISEKQLAESHHSYWEEALPFLNGTKTAAIEKTGERWGEEIEAHPDIDTKRMDFLSEVASELMYVSCNDKVRIAEFEDEIINAISKNAWARILILRRLPSLNKNSEACRLCSLEKSFCLRIARQLQIYFETIDVARPIKFYPKFPGYGPLSSCYGDALTSNALYEIKNVGRTIRATDIKQILIYAALSTLSKIYTIENLCILNARKGVAYTFGVNEILQKCSPDNSQIFASKLVEFLESQAAATDAI